MNEILLTIFNIVIVASGVIYYSRKGTPGAASDVLSIFKLRDEEQKVIINTLREEVTKNGLALANLQGVVSEKDKKIQEYLEIFRGNSPEEKEYREYMKTFTAGVAQYMKDSADILSGMKTFLTQLNEKAISNENRNTLLDQQGGV